MAKKQDEIYEEVKENKQMQKVSENAKFRHFPKIDKYPQDFDIMK